MIVCCIRILLQNFLQNPAGSGLFCPPQLPGQDIRDVPRPLSFSQRLDDKGDRIVQFDRPAPVLVEPDPVLAVEPPEGLDKGIDDLGLVVEAVGGYIKLSSDTAPKIS